MRRPTPEEKERAEDLLISVQEYLRLVDSDCADDTLQLKRLFDSAGRRNQREAAIEFFRSKGVYISGDRTILIAHCGRQYYFYPKTNKWRAKGKTKYYYSTCPENFIEIIERNDYMFSSKPDTEKIHKFNLEALDVTTIYTLVARGEVGKYSTITLDNGLRYWFGYGNDHLKIGDSFTVIPYCSLKSRLEYCRAEVLDKKPKQSRAKGKQTTKVYSDSDSDSDFCY